MPDSPRGSEYAGRRNAVKSVANYLPLQLTDEVNPARGDPGANSLQLATAWILYLGWCLLVQFSAGAWTAPFSTYPDEPAHFVGSIMVRDYLTSGFHTGPMAFAVQYYDHYPFFALGHWPPLFYLISAVWFLVAGIGRTQAMLMQAGIVASSGLLVFWFVRKRAPWFGGFCAGLAFLALPEVQRWLCTFMVDHLVTLFCLGTAAFLLRYLESPTLRNGILLALLATAASLTKYSGIYVCVLPVALIVASGRFYLLRRWSFLVQPLLMGCAILPWWFWTKQLKVWDGFAEGTGAGPAARALSHVLQLFRMFPPAMAVLLGVGLLLLLISPRAWRTDLGAVLMLLLGLILFLAVTPAESEPRFLLTGAASLIVLAAAGWRSCLDRRWPSALAPARRIVPIAAAVLALFFSATQFLGFPHRWDGSIHDVARIIAENPLWRRAGILLPTDSEGPLVAEFILHDPHRPSFILNRPSRVLATSNWGGGDYALKYRSPSDLIEALKEKRIELILLHTRPTLKMSPHDVMLRDGLSQNSSLWYPVPAFEATLGEPSWTLFRYSPGAIRVAPSVR